MNDKYADDLLNNLLQQVDAAAQADPPNDHPDEEILAMFSEGELTGDERSVVVDHLAACVPCRKLVSQVLIAGQEDAVATIAPSRRSIFRQWLPVVLAVAALVLVAIALQFFAPPAGPQLAENNVYEQASRLLATGEFDDVRELVADAGQRGVSSGRLTSLDVQAIRRIPDPLALAAAGRLSDFGYGIGGVVAMGPPDSSVDLESTEQRLEQVSSESFEAALNRGHVLLAMGNADEALIVFGQLVNDSTDEPLAWLGRGLANYMRNDFAAAAVDFRESLRLEPNQVATRINLAMTLEELDDIPGALQIWRELLAEPISEEEKQQIQQNITELEQAL